MAFSALRRPSQFDRSHFHQAVPPRAFQGRFCAFPGTRKTGGRIRALEGPASFLTLQKWRLSRGRDSGGRVMKITIALIPGLPKKELVERIHFHQRQGDIAERALGFYLLDLEKRKMCRPFEDGAEWARKHLPELQRPDKLILLARRLEKLCLLPVYVYFLCRLRLLLVVLLNFISFPVSLLARLGAAGEEGDNAHGFRASALPVLPALVPGRPSAEGAAVCVLLGDMSGATTADECRGLAGAVSGVPPGPY